MPCASCGSPLGNGRTRLCKTCSLNKSRESQLPSMREIYGDPEDDEEGAGDDE